MDDLLEMDEQELNEKLTELQEEREQNEKDMKPYGEDIEEGNYDGVSIEMVAYVAEIESEVDDILTIMKKKDYDIPDGYEHRAEEL